MPIERYRSIEDVPAPVGRDPGDPQAMKQVFDFLANPLRELPPLFPPGLYKYRSIEEANAAKEAAIIERARLLRGA